MNDRDHLYSRVEHLEQRLGIPAGFTRRLNREDDWSFVIKAHAFIEALVTHLLVQATDVRLEDVFVRLQLGGRTGKMAFVKSLGLLTPANQRFVERISAIRNSIVHNVANVGFRFNDFLTGLDKGERRAAIRDLLGSFDRYADRLAADDAAEIKRDPQAIIRFALLGVALDAYCHDTGQPEQVDSELSLIDATVGIFLSLSDDDSDVQE